MPQSTKKSNSPKASKVAKTLLAQVRETENQLKLARAKSEIKQIQMMTKVRKRQLSTYEAASRDRRFEDWRAPKTTADQAILPDKEIIDARVRQLVRDTGTAKSIVRAYVRNIVGRGIRVVPNAKDKNGKPLTEFNKVAAREYEMWEKSKDSDLARTQPWPQKQRLAVEERGSVGEFFLGWSYIMPKGRFGNLVDLSKPVGLKLQGLESEMLDMTLTSFNGNKIRGGVEVDENGAALAYHFKVQNGSGGGTYGGSGQKPVRVERERIFHYFKQERVQQARGISPMVPVMGDIRDAERHKQYTLAKVVLEACIGVIINRKVIPEGNGGNPFYNGQAFDQGSGVGEVDYTTSQRSYDEIDFRPGTVIKGGDGDEVSGFNTGNPGSAYGPFQELTSQSIGAGVGMSAGQINRTSKGNYSASRQDGNMDWQEWEPEQDLLISDLVKPVYEQFLPFAVAEGRFKDVQEFDVNDFVKNPHLYLTAIYIGPPQVPIDQEKEALAYAILLKNRLITRQEIVTKMGKLYEEHVHRLHDEMDEMENDFGLLLPENDENRKQLREVVRVMLGARTGQGDVLATNAIDVEGIVGEAKMTQRKMTQPTLPLIDPNARPAGGAPGSGVQQHDAGGQFTATGKASKKKEAPATKDKKLSKPRHLPVGRKTTVKDKGAKSKKPVKGVRILATTKNSPANNNSVKIPVAAQNDNPKPVVSLPQLTLRPPNFRVSEVRTISCGTCSYFQDGLCIQFNAQAAELNLCDAWEALPIVANAYGNAKTESPFFDDADPAFDDGAEPYARRRPGAIVPMTAEEGAEATHEPDEDW